MERHDVTVVIPCYNHGRFLPDAIGSVLAQTHPAAEIVMVDDGSIDETREVASRYPNVKYIYQANRGLAAARNTGVSASTSAFLVFLDADDVLSPDALSIGVTQLLEHPDCAFVSGDHRIVGPDLKPRFKFRARPVQRDHYLAFLRGNYVGMHATVMYRREVLERVGGFDETLRACEDYEIYLRISRNYPVHCHGHIVADYRHHGRNMSRNAEFMLHWVLKVHDAERLHLNGDAAREEAFGDGDTYLREYYCGQLLSRVWARFHISPADVTAVHELAFVAANYPLISMARRKAMERFGYWATVLKRIVRRSTVWPPVGRVDFGSFRSTARLRSAVETSDSVVGWYNQHWRTANSEIIQGDRIDISDEPRLLDKIACLPSERYDCVLCFMSLHRSIDVPLTVRHLLRILKPSGVLLGTVPGVVVGQARTDSGDFWRFTALSARRLLEQEPGAGHVVVEAFGNVFTATAALHNLPAVSLKPDELLASGPQHETVVAFRAVKS